MRLRSVNDLDSATDVSIPLDVRGWAVRTTTDDEKVGSVHDVLVDEGGAARYLDIDLGIFQKHVLLPVGQAIADEKDDLVWVHAMDKDSFDEIPGYDHDMDTVNTEVEQRLTTSYDNASRHRRYDRPEYGGSWRGARGLGGTAAAGAGASTAGGTQDPTVLGTEHVRLRRLSDLGDYEVADRDPDPRGWEIIGAGGESLGEVDDLVVDPQAMKARYLEIELKNDIIGDEESNHLLVPVGYARLDEGARRVRVDALRATDVRSVPRYADEFDEPYEDRVDRHFAQGFQGERRYHHPRYDAERLYATRDIAPATGAAERGRICDVRLRR